MRISVVIVTHLGGELLAMCLQSLAAQRRPPDSVLVVVSNAVLAVEAPSLQLGSNLGYARAANAGLGAAEGEVLLLNDDTRLDPGCLAALEAAWAGPGIYQPRIELEEGGVDNVGHGFFPDGFVWARGRHGGGVPAGAPGGFSGAAVLVSRSVWDALGGFDPRFDSYGEDVDLSLRWLRRGGVIHVVPDAMVWHRLGATYGRTGASKVRRIERNRVRAAVRSMPLTALATMPVWTAGRLMLFAGLAAAGRGPGKDVSATGRAAAVAGLIEGVVDIPTWWRERRCDAASWQRGEWAMWAALWRGRARWEDVWRA